MPDDRKPLHPDMVRTAVATGGIQKQELANRAGLHKNSMVGIEDDSWNPKWSNLQALCAAAEDIKRERA